MMEKKGILAISTVITVLVLCASPSYSYQYDSPITSTKVSDLQPPVDKLLFPGMTGLVPKIFHLPQFDVVRANTVYLPDDGVRERRPDYFCRAEYGGFLPQDLSTPFLNYQNFRHAFLEMFVSDHVYGKDPFWMGNFIEVHQNDGTRYVDFYSGAPQKILGQWKMHTPFFNGVGARQLCIRRTYMEEEYRCGGKMVMVQTMSYQGERFDPARASCRKLLGFDLPTSNALAYLSNLTDPHCQHHGHAADNLWTQSTRQGTAGTKNYICMGCHVHFRDGYGMKYVDSNGKVTCKGGFILERLNNTTPVCKVDGYWDMKTIGRCRQNTIVNVDQKLYYLLLNETSFQDANCPVGERVNFKHSEVSVESDIKKKLHVMLSSWATRKAWISPSALITSDKTVIVLPSHHDGSPSTYTSNQSYWTVCKVECFQPSKPSTVSHLDQSGGLVTCQSGFIWTCEHDGCARDGQPSLYPKCKYYEDYNYPGGEYNQLATCNNVHQTMIDQVARTTNLSLDFSTATVSCANGYYESCVGKECAGGPHNIPAKNNGSHFTNLPNCTQLKFTTSGSEASYALAQSHETADLAKWACEQNGMYLLSDLHLSASMYTTQVGNIWLEDPLGRVRLRHGTKWSEQPKDIKAHFVCVKYLPDSHIVFNKIDYSVHPEKCKTGQSSTDQNGQHYCSSAQTGPADPTDDSAFYGWLNI